MQNPYAHAIAAADHAIRAAEAAHAAVKNAIAGLISDTEAEMAMDAMRRASRHADAAIHAVNRGDQDDAEISAVIAEEAAVTAEILAGNV